MSSLAEVYEGHVGAVEHPRRLYLGTGLFLAGALLSVVGLGVATTGVLSGLGVTTLGARELAGVLAGLGVPALLVGVFTVLPAGRVIRAAAAVGASVCVLGVALFVHAYPEHWAGYGHQLTAVVAAVYAFGLITATWCLFVAVANFKTRNDPGGTVTLEVTREGETRVVEVDRSDLEKEGLGGVGVFGGRPDGSVDTQTSRRDDRSAGTDRGTRAGTSDGATAGSTVTGQEAGGDASGADGNGPGPAADAAAPAQAAGAASDGGAAERDLSSPLDDAELVDEDAGRQAPAGDVYCGNCEHFRYVRDHGMTPYCGHRDERMDDMDACEEWAPNR